MVPTTPVSTCHYCVHALFPAGPQADLPPVCAAEQSRYAKAPLTQVTMQQALYGCDAFLYNGLPLCADVLARLPRDEYGGVGSPLHCLADAGLRSQADAEGALDIEQMVWAAEVDRRRGKTDGEPYYAPWLLYVEFFINDVS